MRAARWYLALQAAQSDGKRGEALAHVVVQLARDPGPFGLLGRDQPAGQAPGAGMAVTQGRLTGREGLLGPDSFGDLFHHTTHTGDHTLFANRVAANQPVSGGLDSSARLPDGDVECGEAGGKHAAEYRLQLFGEVWYCLTQQPAPMV